MNHDESLPKEAHESPAHLATTTIVPPTHDAMSCFLGAYAVMVIGKAARRHVYFGLPAAERAVQRAQERGDYAEMVLVQLVPVGGGAR